VVELRSQAYSSRGVCLTAKPVWSLLGGSPRRGGRSAALRRSQDPRVGLLGVPARREKRSSERGSLLCRGDRPSGRSTRREAVRGFEPTLWTRKWRSPSGALRFWVGGGVRSRGWAGVEGPRIPASCPGSRQHDRTSVCFEASASDRLEGWSQGGKPHRGRCVLGFRVRV